MTLHEVVQHIGKVNIGGWYNREKMPKGWLETYLKHMFSDNQVQHIFEVAMEDGWWYVSVTRFSNGSFGYFIPETREQEQKIKDELFSK